MAFPNTVFILVWNSEWLRTILHAGHGQTIHYTLLPIDLLLHYYEGHPATAQQNHNWEWGVERDSALPSFQQPGRTYRRHRNIIEFPQAGQVSSVWIIPFWGSSLFFCWGGCLRSCDLYRQWTTAPPPPINASTPPVPFWLPRANEHPGSSMGSSSPESTWFNWFAWGSIGVVPVKKKEVKMAVAVLQ